MSRIRSKFRLLASSDTSACVFKNVKKAFAHYAISTEISCAGPNGVNAFEEEIVSNIIKVQEIFQAYYDTLRFYGS